MHMDSSDSKMQQSPAHRPIRSLEYAIAATSWVEPPIG